MSSLNIEEIKAEAKMIFLAFPNLNGLKTFEQAVAIALKGRDFRWSVAQSIEYINIIKGKPCLNAQGMNALIRSIPGASLDFLEYSDERCTIKASRPGSQPLTVTWTAEDAKRAGLAGDNWQRFPRAMLRSRCLTDVARTMFPDAIGGLYLDSEIADEPEVPQLSKRHEPLLPAPSAPKLISQKEIDAMVASFCTLLKHESPYETAQYLEDCLDKPLEKFTTDDLAAMQSHYAERKKQCSQPQLSSAV